MEAVNDFVFIKKTNPKEKIGNIIMPFDRNIENGIGEPYTGLVISVGDEAKLVKKNDIVVFDDMCNPWLIEYLNEQILVLREKDIIGVINNGN